MVAAFFVSWVTGRTIRVGFAIVSSGTGDGLGITILNYTTGAITSVVLIGLSTVIVGSTVAVFGTVGGFRITIFSHAGIVITSTVLESLGGSPWCIT